MTRMWDELANGTTIVLAGEPWSATETLRLIRDEHITMGTGVPTQWELVLAHPDLARTDFSAAPGVRHRRRRDLARPRAPHARDARLPGAQPLHEHRGRRDHEHRRSAIRTRSSPRPSGGAAPEVELRIVAPRRTRRAASSAGEVGEIVCRSPAMMRGYWRDPELTATVIDRDGWLHTGDLGTIDADGNVRIVGRLKEMYIRGGYNVYPTEVEAVLAEPPGGRAGRSGRAPRPGARRGRRRVRRCRATRADPPELADLRDGAGPGSRTTRHPTGWSSSTTLPVTPMHKVDKAALRATYETTEAT